MDTLKSAWQGMPGREKQQHELRGMLQEGKHPVLKQLRRQVIFESLLFTVFLVVYYDFFDGNRKPPALNALLVSGVLLVIVHGILGYFAAKQPVKGNSLHEALSARLKQLKTFAILSVTFRVLSTVCMLLFFTYAITFTVNKQLIFGGAAVILLIQFAILVWMWVRRIARLGAAAKELN